jgi:hydroxyacylglutathione hydrolase
MIIHKTKNVTVFQSGMYQVNSTVITTDDLVLIVDPGYLPREVDEIRHYVERIKGSRPTYLYFTHSDFDHIVGYGAFPEAKTIASKELVENPIRESQVKDLIKYDDEFYLLRPYPVRYPVIDHIISADGEQLKIGETVLTFYHAFGHNHDGLIAVVEFEMVLIAGDYLSDIEFPFVYYDVNEYKRTINTLQRRLEESNAFTLIPSHGSVTNDPTEIQQRINDSKQYLRLLTSEPTEEQFTQFLIEKEYRFTTIFKKRHEDNLQIVRNGSIKIR